MSPFGIAENRNASIRQSRSEILEDLVGTHRLVLVDWRRAWNQDEAWEGASALRERQGAGQVPDPMHYSHWHLLKFDGIVVARRFPLVRVFCRLRAKVE